MISIRQETTLDYSAVEHVIQKAFEQVEISDQTEHQMVKRLRKTESFIPELSLVAEQENQIIGHILLSKIKVVDENEIHNALALAPVSVLPKFQRQGIGSKLIIESHRVAKSLAHKTIILIGHEKYYPRFGYKKCSQYNISFPFKVPDDNCMVIELQKDALNKVKGMVQYPSAFFEND